MGRRGRRAFGGIVLACALLALACAPLSLLPSHARAAEDYPSRPVTIVVPFTPGGSTDFLARYAAEVLQRDLHQSFVVENRSSRAGARRTSSAPSSRPKARSGARSSAMPGSSRNELLVRHPALAQRLKI
jgi:tripartite-type tricarboxylate transporter receptor subunit TctC